MNKKKRFARRLESTRIFKPSGVPVNQCHINKLSIDQFEALRLIDFEGKSQIDAAKEMDISRSTIQRLVESARKTLVQTILLNNGLTINNDISHIRLKGENKKDLSDYSILKIAFPTTDKVTICSDFSSLKEFMVYTIQDLEIIAVQPLPIYVSIDFNIPIVLREHKVNLVMTSTMDKKMIKHMDQQGIDVVLGGKGRIDVNLNEYLSGYLSLREHYCEPTSNQKG